MLLTLAGIRTLNAVHQHRFSVKATTCVLRVLLEFQPSQLSMVQRLAIFCGLAGSVWSDDNLSTELFYSGHCAIAKGSHAWVAWLRMCFGSVSITIRRLHNTYESAPTFLRKKADFGNCEGIRETTGGGGVAFESGARLQPAYSMETHRGAELVELWANGTDMTWPTAMMCFLHRLPFPLPPPPPPPFPQDVFCGSCWGPPVLVLGMSSMVVCHACVVLRNGDYMGTKHMASLMSGDTV